MLDKIRDKVEHGERITREEGMYLLRDAPLLDLAPLAQVIRFRNNPAPVVTFVVDTNLNYTNVCDAYCTFCAFYRTAKAEDAYTRSIEEMMDKFEQASKLGVTTVLLQGGLNPDIPFDYYLDLIRATRERFPDIHPHFFSAPEVKKMEQVSGLTLPEVLRALYEAGLRTIPGGGSEILSDRVKPRLTKLFPKATSADWLDVHREAHRAGLRSTATMMYGHLEQDEDIIEHLEVTRELQDETGGFTAFIPWSYKRDNTSLAKKVRVEAAFLPIASSSISRPCSSSRFSRRRASRRTFVLNAAHKPRSLVMTMTMVLCSGSWTFRSGCSTFSAAAARSPTASRNVCAYGRDSTADCWARWSLAVATISMVFVILRVFWTDLRRVTSSRVLAMGPYDAASAAASSVSSAFLAASRSKCSR